MPAKITKKSVAAAKPATTGKAVQMGTKGDPKDHPGKPNGRRRGRPKGSLNKATIYARDVMEGDLKEVIGAVKSAALDGDVQAQKFYISRFVPPARSAPVQIELPPINTPTDILSAFDWIWAAVGAGEITLDDMDRLRVLLEARLKAIEVVELAARIERLEEHAGVIT